MTVEDQINNLIDRVQRLEGAQTTLLKQLSDLEAQVAATPRASAAAERPRLTVLTDNGRGLQDAYIHKEVRIGSSLAEPTRWKLNGKKLGTFQYGWYNIDIPVGQNTIEISTLDGSQSSVVEFNVLED